MWCMIHHIGCNSWIVLFGSFCSFLKNRFHWKWSVSFWQYIDWFLFLKIYGALGAAQKVLGSRSQYRSLSSRILSALHSLTGLKKKNTWMIPSFLISTLSLILKVNQLLGRFYFPSLTYLFGIVSHFWILSTHLW